MQKRNRKDDSKDDDERKTTGRKTHGTILILFIFYLSCVLTLHAAKSKPKPEIATKGGKDGQSLQRTSGEKLTPTQCVLKSKDSMEGLVLNDWFEDYENLPVHQNLVCGVVGAPLTSFLYCLQSHRYLLMEAIPIIHVVVELTCVLFLQKEK
jgi:hypothetical protein